MAAGRDMTAKNAAGAKDLAPPSEEFEADPAAWARKLRRNLRHLENGALLEFAIERAVECEALRQFAAWQAESVAKISFQALGPLDGTRPDQTIKLDEVANIAARGRKFKGGKPPGALEPVAKRVRAYLEKHPTAKAEEVWQALMSRPPKGHDFYEKTARVPRYIRKPDATEMNWPRFRNIVSEHRPPKK